MDDVAADLRAMRIKQLTEKAEDREQWRLVVKRPRLTQGCSVEWMDGFIHTVDPRVTTGLTYEQLGLRQKF
jgi:hypothetical protein